MNLISNDGLRDRVNGIKNRIFNGSKSAFQSLINAYKTGDRNAGTYSTHFQCDYCQTILLLRNNTNAATLHGVAILNESDFR